MSKFYYVEAQFQKNKWELISVKTRQADALHYIKEHINDYIRYPLRIVRIERKTVFTSERDAPKKQRTKSHS